jgi:hypothetical protein
VPQKAIGLPDPTAYGSPEDLQPGTISPFFVQEHAAERAGLHSDVRLGNAKRKLLSWAVRKGLPPPGGKHYAVMQPLHEEAYGPWEGQIASGYGAGEVRSKVRGRALITGVDEAGVSFVTAHEKYPQRFRLQRTEKLGDKAWLLINTTPDVPREYKKISYRVVPAKDVEQLFTPENVVTAKIDGSAAWYEILGDKIEALSYRTSKQTGRPIVHTERAELYGHQPGLGKHRDTVLRGEMFGMRAGKAVPAAELGGLLNATVERSLELKRQKQIKMYHAVFDILQYRGKDVSGLPYEQRLKLIDLVLKDLPKSFTRPPTARTPEEMRKLWRDIQRKRNPYSEEGIIASPLRGGVPTKVKLYPESDVVIENVFAGEGGLKGEAAGGFEYSLPSKPGVIVGRVGTGFGRDDRVDMWRNPDSWIGRTVRIKAQEQFPSGAYRAPVFIARHEG